MKKQLYYYVYILHYIQHPLVKLLCGYIDVLSVFYIL